MKAFTITLSSDNLFDTIAGKSEIFHCLGTPCLIKLVFFVIQWFANPLASRKYAMVFNRQRTFRPRLADSRIESMNSLYGSQVFRMEPMPWLAYHGMRPVCKGYYYWDRMHRKEHLYWCLVKSTDNEFSALRQVHLNSYRPGTRWGGFQCPAHTQFGVNNLQGQIPIGLPFGYFTESPYLNAVLSIKIWTRILMLQTFLIRLKVQQMTINAIV